MVLYIARTDFIFNLYKVEIRRGSYNNYYIIGENVTVWSLNDKIKYISLIFYCPHCT